MSCINDMLSACLAKLCSTNMKHGCGRGTRTRFWVAFSYWELQPYWGESTRKFAREQLKCKADMIRWSIYLHSQSLKAFDLFTSSTVLRMRLLMGRFCDNQRSSRQILDWRIRVRPRFFSGKTCRKFLILDFCFPVQNPVGRLPCRRSYLK